MLNHKSIKFFKLAVNSDKYKETTNDIACKCPICGDSKKNRNSKRLHLYNKGNTDTDFVNCFNSGCPVQNKNMYTFIRDFYPDLLPQYKKEIFGTKMASLKDISLNNITKEPKKAEKGIVPKEILSFDLTPFFEELSQDMLQYLHNRGISPHFNNQKWYKANTNIKIQETVYNIKDYLIIPLYCNDKMYGFYSRDINDKKFITFISTVGYKVWNFFNIDKSEPVYIFEAIFDGISTGYTNIIANLGAKLPEDRLKELKNPIFCLDNDSTGIKNSIHYSERGYKVYVQPKEYQEKDFNELKLNHPTLDIKKLIQDNIYSGISASTRLKMKL